MEFNCHYTIGSFHVRLIGLALGWGSYCMSFVVIWDLNVLGTFYFWLLWILVNIILNLFHSYGNSRHNSPTFSQGSSVGSEVQFIVCSDIYMKRIRWNESYVFFIGNRIQISVDSKRSTCPFVLHVAINFTQHLLYIWYWIQLCTM